jgi:PPOX class probable F420-dependent enzyme
MTDLAAFAELVPLDHGLCVFSTLRADGALQSTVVNAGVLPHPLTGGRVVGLVAAGGTRKVRNLRADPRCTIVVRAGWQWAAVDGTAQIVGPDDGAPDVDAEVLRRLLREIFEDSSEPPPRSAQHRTAQASDEDYRRSTMRIDAAFRLAG